MRFYVLGLFVIGCGTSANEPAPDESFTMTSGPTPTSVAPADSTQGEVPFGPAPWVGRLKSATHHYWNGCTDHRAVELLALVRDHRPIPIILGWRSISPRHREEPHFLTTERELPASAQGHACVLVTGTVVTYAHEGISGAPAYGIAASRIEPYPCP